MFLPIIFALLSLQNARRKAAQMVKYPNAKVINLRIGNTTEPIPEVITSAMAEVGFLDSLFGTGLKCHSTCIFRWRIQMSLQFDCDNGCQHVSDVM